MTDTALGALPVAAHDELESPARRALRRLVKRKGAVVGLVVIAIFIVLAVYGATTWLRNSPVGSDLWRARALLAGFVVYVALTAQAVDAAQSRHRAPAEFALCLLAVAGWAKLRSRTGPCGGR